MSVSPLGELSSSSLSPSAHIEESCSSMMQSKASSPSEFNKAPVKGRSRRRRKFKSALYFALTVAALLCPTATEAFASGSQVITQRKSEWIERSVEYYSGVMRKKVATVQQLPKTTMDSTIASSSISEVPLMPTESNIIEHLDSKFVDMATKHYYARILVKKGKWDFAEKLYRRIINELTSDPSEDDCDHTKLAISTLLLALHMQRIGDTKATRAVFLNFFRRVAQEMDEEHKCSCSAKVLQAYALFEMKCGHPTKSLEIIQRAVKMDETLSTVLKWKQFRDAAAGREYRPTFSFRRQSELEKEGGLSM